VTEVPEFSARRETQLVKLRRYKTAVNYALQPRDSAVRVHFCNWFLQSVVEGEIDSQLTLFGDETWLHLKGYINTQNNRYCSSRNPRLIHEVQLQPLKVGVWCAESARRIVGPVFLYRNS
jgi:hypothetical protein